MISVPFAFWQSTFNTPLWLLFNKSGFLNVACNPATRSLMSEFFVSSAAHLIETAMDVDSAHQGQ